MKIHSQIALLLCLALTLVPLQTVPAQKETAVLLLNLNGPITSAMSDYLNRGIQTAENQGAQLVVLQLNTPGGSISTMQQMVEAVRASRVPVVVYVAPQGAIAGSAGTVITLAGHKSAMAPETVIGAASPVGPGGEDLTETSRQKAEEIVKAQIRSLAAGRGEEAVAFAEETVSTAAAASAEEALEVGLIDYLAEDLTDLLNQLDGETITINSAVHTLATAGIEPTPLNQTLIEQVLQLLTDPNIVFLLLILGVQAVLIEISSPGGWVSGFIGAVCLALAGYGLGILPVNWFGLVFLIAALVLFIMDINTPTQGALTAAGVGSMIAGALVLFNSPSTPEFQRVSVWLVIAGSLLSGLVIGAAMTAAFRSQKTPVKTGKESLIGRIGFSKSEIAENQKGNVLVAGELWRAALYPGEDPIHSGDMIEVMEVSGLLLHVRKKK